MLNDSRDYNNFRLDQYNSPVKLPKDGDYWEELGECDEEDCEEMECPYKPEKRRLNHDTTKNKR